MTTPEDIQRDIERTRQTLSADVDRLTDKVSPSKAMGRRVDSVKGTAVSMKERIMGSADDGSGVRGARDSVSSSVSGARDSVGSAMSSVSDAASNAPETVRRQTQGNPLAAGLIAFGVGWLASSLLPASQKEQDLARTAQDKATDLAEPLKEKAQELASNMQEPLQHSAEQIKSTASDAASETADQARSSVQDVKQPLQQ